MHGYTHLAALMGRQNEYNIFRRYKSLRALRLLQLSVELVHLSRELGVVVDMDRNSGDPERGLFESYFQRLYESKEHPEKSLQVQAWNTLGLKLREYGEHAVWLQYHVQCLSPLRTRALTASPAIPTASGRPDSPEKFSCMA